MGLPGVIHIRITTEFNEQQNSVSRTVQHLGGWGLNSLGGCSFGTGRYWHLDREIVKDTLELPDGVHTLERKHVGPGHFDYQWSPTENEED